MKKRVISVVIAICMMFCISVDAFAATSVTGGFAGISTYNYCVYGNRAGANYVNNLDSGLNLLGRLGFCGNYTRSYKYLNNEVTTSNCTGPSAVTFFAYSGHGIVYDQTANNALHVNYNSGSIKSHSSLGETTSTTINKLTSSTRFSHKYVVLYTCNQLTNNNSAAKSNNILKMMNGTRLILGFASVMYLDSREATLFTTKMRTETIVNAFTAAAEYYQVQRDSGDSIARAVGYNSALNDRISTTYSNAPSAANNLSSFGILKTVKVPHTGVTI